MTGSKQTLSAKHRTDLLASGLTDETIADAGIYSESDPVAVARILNWTSPAHNLGPCLVFPFPDPSGQCHGFASLKPDTPRSGTSKSGKVRLVKYEHPKGIERQPYFTPSVRQAIAHTANGEIIAITEGAKKTLAIDQAGIPCIGLSGVNAWSRKKQADDEKRVLNDWLANIDWSDRRVAIIFDTDSKRNPNVAREAALLAEAIELAGGEVRIVELPHGPREADGAPGKMGADDFIVAASEGALVSLVEKSFSNSEPERSLDDYRQELRDQRVESVGKPGVYLDTSPTGAGKSHADIEAIRVADNSLTLVPAHENGGEVEGTYRKHGLDATAYPRLDKKTCGNHDEAEKALASGLSPSAAICPKCPLLEECEYQARLKEADSSSHRIACHKRAEVSCKQISDGVKFVTIHEDPIEVLRPKLQVGHNVLREVAKVAEKAYYLAGQRCGNQSETQYFLWQMEKVCESLQQDLSKSRKTTEIELPTPASPPRHVDQLLWEAMKEFKIFPDGMAMRLVRSLVEGKVTQAICRTWSVEKDGERIIQSEIWAVQTNEFPANATVWISDATADPDALELALGRPIVNKTPSGKLRASKATVQIPEDITCSAQPSKVVNVLYAILLMLPQYARIGVIAHRKLESAILGTACDGVVLDGDLRKRIVEFSYFRSGASRGMNTWHQNCDLLLVVGTPRVPPQVLERRLVQIGNVQATKRAADWGNDYWLGHTISGQPRVIKCLGYRDRDWHSAYRAVVAAELTQSLGRGRGLLENGIPTVVVTTEPLGLPLLDEDVSPMSREQRTMLDALKTLAASTQVPIEMCSDNAADLSEQMSNIYNIDMCSVSTSDVARLVKVSDRQARKMLNKLKERGLVRQIGKRKGWVPVTETPINLELLNCPNP